MDLVVTCGDVENCVAVASRLVKKVRALLCQVLDTAVISGSGLRRSCEDRCPALLSILIIDHLLKVR